VSQFRKSQKQVASRHRRVTGGRVDSLISCPLDRRPGGPVRLFAHTPHRVRLSRHYTRPFLGRAGYRLTSIRTIANRRPARNARRSHVVDEYFSRCAERVHHALPRNPPDICKLVYWTAARVYLLRSSTCIAPFRAAYGPRRHSVRYFNRAVQHLRHTAFQKFARTRLDSQTASGFEIRHFNSLEIHCFYFIRRSTIVGPPSETISWLNAAPSNFASIVRLRNAHQDG
jgi:hypothetical protein